MKPFICYLAFIQARLFSETTGFLVRTPVAKHSSSVLLHGHAAPAAAIPESDNFADEVKDQADNEFVRIAGGDTCISRSDLKKIVLAQFANVDASKLTGKQLTEMESVKANLIFRAQKMFQHADKNIDGCVDLAEYKATQEFENPSAETAPQSAATPPDLSSYQPPLNQTEFTELLLNNSGVPPYLAAAMFEFLDLDASGNLSHTELYKIADKWKADQVRANQLVQKHYQIFQHQKDLAEFSAMDSNGDRQLSKNEVTNFASESMPQSDISYKKLLQMFDAADTNNDQFLSFEEFVNAGAQFTGDGKATLMNIPASNRSNQTSQNLSAPSSTKSMYMKDKPKVTLQILLGQLRPFMHGLDRSVPALMRHIGRDDHWNASA